MIKIFGLLFFIILICLIYLHYQGKISSNIPIIFMFFLILVIPFTYLETNKKNIENYSNYDQIMNSSLDIFYTNEKSKERTIEQMKKIKLINNPIQTVLVQRDVAPITLTIYTKYYSPYTSINIASQNIYENIYTAFGNDITYTYITNDDLFNKNYDNIKTRIKLFYKLELLTKEIDIAPNNSFIIIIANNNNFLDSSEASVEVKNKLINEYKFGSWINNNFDKSWQGAFIVILSKVILSGTTSYSLINEKFTTTNNILSITQNLIADSAYFKDNGGETFKLEATRDRFEDILNNELIKSKTNIISPLNSNYSLSFTAENNESFVYLSSRQLNDQVVLYDDSKMSSTYLDTQKPQFWSFEPVTKIITSPLIVFIRTYSRPYFYLDAELENGVMILKVSRFKAALRQQWEIINDGSNYKIRHLKSGMYLGYSDFDGYLYKDDGSVFLSKSSNYIWNIKKILENNINRNVIESFEVDRPNLLEATENPNDFGSVENPSWNLSDTLNSKGRTIWDPTYSSIWSGKWIYNGTVESYKATLNINNVKFLIIDIDQNGNGIINDEYYNFKMNTINTGSNILTGIIPSGKYKGYRAILKIIPSDLKYSDPSKPFPVKMRYFIQKNSTIFNLSSGDINNMNGYSTKFVGDKLILSDFLEASGIQTDPNLAFSEKDLNIINKSIYEQLNPTDFEKLDNTNCVNGRLYNGYRKDGSNNDYKYLGDFSSYDECSRSPNIPINAKAITYHNDKIEGWARQCFSINDNNTKVANRNYAVCGVRIVPKIMYGPGIGREYITQIKKLNNGKIVYLIYDDNKTKMVSSDGQEKYYSGTIEEFNKKNWDSYSNNNGDRYKLKDIKPKIMYGDWVAEEKETIIKDLNNGKFVYIIYDENYTKMISSDGTEKFYLGPIEEFNPKNWDSYNNTGGGKFLLKDIFNFEKLDNTNCVYDRLYKGYRKDGSFKEYKYLGDFKSYEECAKSPNIPADAKAITYYKNNKWGWGSQCFSINDNKTKVPNQDYAICGIKR